MLNNSAWIESAAVVAQLDRATGFEPVSAATPPVSFVRNRLILQQTRVARGASPSGVSHAFGGKLGVRS